MDARRLFAFSTWRIARVERPFVVIDATGSRAILTFTLRDLARGCALGCIRIDSKADNRRWESLCVAVDSLEPTPQGLLELTDAEVDVALDAASGYLTYRAVPELVAIRAAEIQRKVGAGNRGLFFRVPRLDDPAWDGRATIRPCSRRALGCNCTNSRTAFIVG